MTRPNHKYRVRYFGQVGALHDVEIAAKDTAMAIRAAREAQWPPRAIGFRIVDDQGREVCEELRAARR
jgi:hypothetical protein